MSFDLSPRRRWGLALGLAGTLALLAAHARLYAFLCDDAFISFRYARNLARGFGLVFNPGSERVEGYTNFLWVLILAAAQRVGIAPEQGANVLLAALTVALWALVARRAWSSREPGMAGWLVLVPPLLLALTRSVAVWSTSGLETRLFEVLVLAGALRLAHEVRISADARREVAPFSALLFALAALTRPDGLLVAGAAIGAGVGWRWLHGALRVRTLALQAAIFGGIVGGHLLWRHAYYGAWLPNTYYAKVGGRAWWEMGGVYLAGFVLEYAVVLWLPLLAAGIVALVRRGRGHEPLIFAAVVLPHALYVASIGGDHFEYRPLDLYFPFAFLLIGEGCAAAAEWARGRPLRAVATGAALVAIVWGLVWLPWQSHRQFVGEYQPGFPGFRPESPPAARFLDPAADPVYRLPGLRAVGEAHRDLIRRATGHFVGVRAEEHALFLPLVANEGRTLRGLVERGILPADTHVAIAAVGAIPYYSDLRTLDRLGLTDAVVARSAPSSYRVLAHDKHATIAYARERGVDLWAEVPMHLILPLGDARLDFHLARAEADEAEVFFADVGEFEVLLVRLPRGLDDARRRMPSLDFQSTRDPDALAALRRKSAAVAKSRREAEPDSLESRVARALDRAREGDPEGAIAALRAIDDGEDVEVLFNLGTLLGETGRLEEAAAMLRRAAAARPDFADAWFNLGVVEAKAGRLDPAFRALENAVAVDPGHARARYTLGAVALALGRRETVEEQARALAELDTAAAARLSERLRAALAGGTP